MSGIRIERVGHACGARITGVDLSKKLSQEELDCIHRAWLEHLVVVFPGQQLDARALVRFTSRFGPLDDYATQPFNRHPEINEVMVLTNRRTGGKPSRTYNAGQNWHTDLSYTLRPAKATSVYCVEKPSVGGDTMFANMYLAYETLSPKMREFLDGLEAVHDASLIEGLDQRGPEVANEFRRLNPPVVHPVVRTHPVSGRRGIFVNHSFTTRIVELAARESDAILEMLFAHLSRPEYTVRWAWKTHDLAFWDNRLTQHYACADYMPHRRVMHRATILGDRPR